MGGLTYTEDDESHNINEEDETLGEDEYVCTLEDRTLKVAFSELHEDEVVRKQGLLQLRDWIRRSQVITKCRLDGNFLMRFLRAKKFKVNEAQTLLESYLRMRTENQHWFCNLDIYDPEIEDLIDRGYFFALPERDDNGRRVFFCVASALDAYKDSAALMMKVVQLGIESLLEEEENQVHGFTYIFDEKNVGLSLLTLWTPNEVSKAFQCCEKKLPIRHKEVHFLNLPFTLYAVFEFAKAMLSDKIRNRLKVHSDESKLRKKIPSRILPREYGGTLAMADMIQMYKKELLSVRSRVLMLDNMVIEKKPKHKKLEKTICSLQRSLKRFEID